MERGRRREGVSIASRPPSPTSRKESVKEIFAIHPSGLRHHTLLNLAFFAIFTIFSDDIFFSLFLFILFHHGARRYPPFPLFSLPYLTPPHFVPTRIYSRPSPPRCTISLSHTTLYVLDSLHGIPRGKASQPLLE